MVRLVWHYDSDECSSTFAYTSSRVVALLLQPPRPAAVEPPQWHTRLSTPGYIMSIHPWSSEHVKRKLRSCFLYPNTFQPYTNLTILPFLLLLLQFPSLSSYASIVLRHVCVCVKQTASFNLLAESAAVAAVWPRFVGWLCVQQLDCLCFGYFHVTG